MKTLLNNRNKCYVFYINPSCDQISSWTGCREIIIKPGTNNIEEGDYTILEPQIQNHLNSTLNGVNKLNKEIEEATYKGLLTLKAELEAELSIVSTIKPVFEVSI